MLKVTFTKQVKKFIKNLPLKQAKQLAFKIQELRNNPYSQDFKKLKGSAFLRVDSGEYRIIYNLNVELLEIILLDKRNDDSVYKKLKRL